MSPANPLRAVIFDWDGTLLNSYHADAAAFLDMFRELGTRWSLRDLEKHYSPNWHRVYRAAGIPRSRWDEADRIWARCYARHRPRLLAGARAVLRWCARRYTLALVTSGNRRRVLRQLRSFGLLQFFSARVYAEDAAHRKPHPAPLALALGRLRLPAKNCVYVGDAPEDIEMARRAGVPAVGFLGPFPTHRRLRTEKPAAIVAELRELPGAVQRIQKEMKRCGETGKQRIQKVKSSRTSESPT